MGVILRKPRFRERQQSFYCDFSTLAGWRTEGDGSFSVVTGNLTCEAFGTTPVGIVDQGYIGPMLARSVSLNNSFTIKTNASFTPTTSGIGGITIALISGESVVAYANIGDHWTGASDKIGGCNINGTSITFLPKSSGMFSGELSFERDNTGLITFKQDGATKHSGTFAGEITDIKLQFNRDLSYPAITSMFIEDVTLTV